MKDLLLHLQPGADAVVALGSSAVLRATLLLAGVAVLAWLVRARSARTRHALWSVTLASLLTLPVLGWVLPAIPVAVPFAQGGEGSAARHFSTGWVDAEPAVATAADLSRSAERKAEHSHAVAQTGGEGVRARSSAAAASAPSTPVPSLPISAIVLLVWLGGAAAGCFGLWLGLWRAHLAARRGSPVVDPAWREALVEATRSLGIARPVALRTTPAVGTPMTGGLLRPVVLLPASAGRWDEERRRLVLLHELVHVARADALGQIVSRLVVALYWFHPLVWWAARKASLAREQACDEAVLAHGQRPSTYARHLIELAEPVALPLPAISRSSRSDLERRIEAVLEPNAGGRRGVAVAAALGGALWALSVAAIAPRASGEIKLPGVAPSTAAMLEPTPGVPLAVGVRARGVGETAAVQEPAPAGRARTCWVDGFHGDFSGTFSQIRDDRGRSTYERFGISDGDLVVQTYLGDVRLCLRAHDPVELDEDLTRIESIGTGGWVVIAAEDGGEDGGAAQQLELWAGPGGIERRWTVDGIERAFDADAEAWRDAVLGVIGPRWQISQIRGRVSSLRGEISSIRGRESSLRGEISSIHGRVSSMRGEISSARGRESGLRGEISSIRGEVSSMRGEISSIRGHESSLRGEISSLRGRISGLESARRATRDEQTRARLVAEIGEVEEAIDEVERRIDEYDADARVAEVEQSIADFDAEAQIRAIEERSGQDDVDQRVREIEERIAAYDADSRIREVEERIAALDVEGEVERLERLIDAEDADRLVAEIEELLEAAEGRLEQVLRVFR
ncbi:MAG TPA: M56 family metallopeptidase [Thermoanaerobaculia bacterium]|nr:M56 family metallopeptidase [Thermoanaerobaculia bacterium]